MDILILDYTPLGNALLMPDLLIALQIKEIWEQNKIEFFPFAYYLCDEFYDRFRNDHPLERFFRPYRFNNLLIEEDLIKKSQEQLFSPPLEKYLQYNYTPIPDFVKKGYPSGLPKGLLKLRSKKKFKKEIKTYEAIASNEENLSLLKIKKAKPKPNPFEENGLNPEEGLLIEAARDMIKEKLGKKVPRVSTLIKWYAIDNKKVYIGFIKQVEDYINKWS